MDLCFIKWTNSCEKSTTWAKAFCAESLDKDPNCYLTSWRKVTYIAVRYCGVENGPWNTTKRKGF